jgi:Galactose oxidase-like, Early set domain
VDTMAQAPAPGAPDSMQGMEHAQDTVGVAPFLDDRVLATFCRAVQTYADGQGAGAYATAKLAAVQAHLQNLVDLASLCRYAVLGEPRAVARVLDEMQCIAVDFPSDPLSMQPATTMTAPPDARTQLAAAVDLFAGAAFVSAGDHDRLQRFVLGLVRAIENAVAFPLAVADEAATYVGEGDGSLAPRHAAIAIANATQRLLENDVNCTPAAPPGFSQRLEALAQSWIEANPVTALLDALTGGAPNDTVASVAPTTAKVGDAVTLQLNGSATVAGDSVVMFCPHQPAEIVSSQDHQLQVVIPDSARSGPVSVVRPPTPTTLDDISALSAKFASDYPAEWALSVFTMIPLSSWAYPAAFSRAPAVDVAAVPKSASIAVFDGAGRRVDGDGNGGSVDVGDDVTIRYEVTPPGSDANAELELSATGGTVTKTPEPGTLRFRPTDTGVGSVQLTWDCYSVRVPIRIGDGGKPNGPHLLPSWSAFPKRLVLADGGAPGSIEIVVSMPDLEHDTTFTLKSTTGQAAVPATAVVNRGDAKASVPVSLVANPNAPALNTPSDVIEITLGAAIHRVEVWIAQPQGRWDPPIEDALGIVGVHAVVLVTGKVLYFSFDHRAVNDKDGFNKYFADPNLGSYQIWDAATQTADAIQPVGRNVFCAGQCALADGSIFVPGGQDGAGAADVTGNWGALIGAWFGSDNGALRDVHTYDPFHDAWTRWPDMNDGRYYPTCQTLADGSTFIAGGLSNLQTFILSGANWCQNDQFETCGNGTLGLGPSPQRKFMSADQYPILRLLPGSRQLFVHMHRTTYLFDLDSSSFVNGAQFMPPSPVGRQTYPMQTGYVVLAQREGDAPRILIVGGSTQTGFDYNTGSDAPSVRGAYIFEYDQHAPERSAWRETTGKPTIGRLLSDVVLLPDGSVFVVNGISKGAASGHSSGTVFQADLFDPSTEMFIPMAPPSPDHPRAYHSTAVLLPDARVAIAGNTGAYNNPDPGAPPPKDDTSIQVFNPPYLFAGPRPTVTGVPESVEYGATVTIDNRGDPPVARVMMMRPCAVTHSQDMDQRAIWLAASTNRTAMTNGRGGTFTFTVPSDASLAPPGPYMLFFLSDAGVPSVASFVLLTPSPAGSSDGSGGGGGDTYPTVYLGTYENGTIVQSVFDGDIVVDKIDQHCNVSLESRHGSITINEKCDQHCWVTLKAATTVSIGQKIDQHCTVQITCNGDVNIGQKIDGNSDASITTSGGSIYIGQKVDGNSSATLNAANGTITIVQKVDGSSKVYWKAQSFNCPDTGGGQITPL